MSDVFDLLRERGFVKDVSDAEGLSRALAEPITAYCGYDPTASSLHVGNLLSVMLLSHLQRAGHRPIVIVGGGTGLIGDPSGKLSQRPMLTLEQVQANLAGQRRQFARFLEFAGDRALILNNADWLLGLGYVSFLREIGRHFSVNQLLQHETFRERVAGEGLSFIEFNYPLLQAFDFLHLYREYGCVLQVGGADQWFNILAGVDLVRRVTGGATFGLVAPLLLTSSGRKMGKTERGAVWLDPELTSPHEYFQYWVNVEDPDVERFLKLYTFLPLDEVRRLGALRGSELRVAKETLAFEATRLCHGDTAAQQARAAARALFGAEGSDEVTLPTVHLARADLAAGVPAAHLFVLTGLCGSRSEAKQLIAQGGAYVNGRRVSSGDDVVDERWLQRGELLVRKGKKRHQRVVPV